jgi:hypothetical protein
MPAKSDTKNMPFKVKDCALITRMAGVTSAVNLRELRERLLTCPQACIFHHFSETLVRPSFDDPEFRNDFAVWSARTLRDRVLAERLGVLNPYQFSSLEDLREAITDAIDERISELPYVLSVPKGDEFIFMQATTVVFDTDLTIKTPRGLAKAISAMSTSTVYYHFIEARRRTPDGVDDFSAWLHEFGEEHNELIKAFKSIDFYYLTLRELKNAIIRTVRPFTHGVQRVR